VNTKNFGSQPFDGKGFQLTISLGGKNYAICDESQYQWLKSSLAEAANARLAKDGKAVTPEELDKEAARLVEERGFSTLRLVLAKMSPQEVERWQASYRFTPFCTKNRH
jgi:hypothetical protein